MSGYFDVESPGDVDGWTPLRALAADTPELRERVAAVGGDDVRAAASVDFLGVAARVLSPAVQSMVDHGRVPALTLDDVWWRPATPGPMRLAYSNSMEGNSLVADVVVPALVPVLDAYASTFAVSRTVLWGDVASAISGAVEILGRGADQAAAVLAAEPFVATARTLPPHFVRNSCCLYYRLSPGSYCGDCVLQVRTRSR